MLQDWRFWACFGVGLLVAAWLAPIGLPFGPVTSWLVLIALCLIGYELGRRIDP